MYDFRFPGASLALAAFPKQAHVLAMCSRLDLAEDRIARVIEKAASASLEANAEWQAFLKTAEQPALLPLNKSVPVVGRVPATAQQHSLAMAGAARKTGPAVGLPAGLDTASGIATPFNQFSGPTRPAGWVAPSPTTPSALTNSARAAASAPAMALAGKPLPDRSRPAAERVRGAQRAEDALNTQRQTARDAEAYTGRGWGQSLMEANRRSGRAIQGGLYAAQGAVGAGFGAISHALVGSDATAAFRDHNFEGARAGLSDLTSLVDPTSYSAATPGAASAVKAHNQTATTAMRNRGDWGADLASGAAMVGDAATQAIPGAAAGRALAPVSRWAGNTSAVKAFSPDASKVLTMAPSVLNPSAVGSVLGVGGTAAYQVGVPAALQRGLQSAGLDPAHTAMMRSPSEIAAARIPTAAGPEEVLTHGFAAMGQLSDQHTNTKIDDATFASETAAQRPQVWAQMQAKMKELGRPDAEIEGYKNTFMGTKPAPVGPGPAAWDPQPTPVGFKPGTEQSPPPGPAPVDASSQSNVTSPTTTAPDQPVPPAGQPAPPAGQPAPPAGGSPSVAPTPPPATPQEAQARFTVAHQGIHDLQAQVTSGKLPAAQAVAPFTQQAHEMIDAHAVQTGQNPAQLKEMVAGLVQDGTVDPSDFAQLHQAIAANPSVQQAIAAVPPAQQPGLWEQFQAMPIHQQAGLALGIPLAILGIGQGLFGEGGMGSILMSILGLAGAAHGMGLFSGNGPLGAAGDQMGMGSLRTLLGMPEPGRIQPASGAAAPGAAPGSAPAPAPVDAAMQAHAATLRNPQASAADKYTARQALFSSPMVPKQYAGLKTNPAALRGDYDAQIMPVLDKYIPASGTPQP